MADSFNELLGIGSHSPNPNLIVSFPQQDDAGSTTVLDYSGNAYNGTLIGAGNTSGSSASGPNGYLAKSLDYDGVNDYTQVSDINALDGLSEFTFHVWMRPHAWNDGMFVFEKGAVFLLGRLSGVTSAAGGFAVNRPSLSFGSANFDAAPALNTWHRVAAVLSAGTLTLYLNGVAQAATVSVPTTIESSAFDFNIGGRDTSFPFDGQLAGLNGFGIALTAAERTELDNGVEPVNIIRPTLQINSSSWSGTVGTWGLPSPYSAGTNGTVTYSWELRDASDDSVVESGSGSSPSGSGSYSGIYYLWVRATNTGGYDPAEDSVSLTKSTVPRSTPLLVGGFRSGGRTFPSNRFPAS